MRIDSLHLLLALLLAATVITAVWFSRDADRARRQAAHARRMRDIAAHNLGVARMQRDAADARAAELEDLLDMSMLDARRHHPAGTRLPATPALSLVESEDSA
jgi:hypothetical protein